MSIVKYRVRDVAADFGVEAKQIAQTLSKFFEKPRSNMQVLTEEQLNVLFDYMTQQNQISSIEQVFAEAMARRQELEKQAAAEKAKKEAEQAAQAEKAAKEAPKAPKESAQPAAQAPKAEARPPKPVKPAKPAEPQRKRERRVVDTSAVTVNAERFDDRVDVLVTAREQNFTGGKQRIGGRGTKKKQQNQKKGKFAGNKSRSEEQEKMRRLQLEIAKKAPLTVKIPDEITVGELASRMKKTAAEVIKFLMRNGVMAGINQNIDFETAEYVATEMGCKVEKEIVVTIEERLFDDHVDTEEELDGAWEAFYDIYYGEEEEE